MQRLFWLLLGSVLSVQGILVKDWGTDSYINRLAYSVHELFNEGFAEVTSSLPGVYPIPGMNHTIYKDGENMDNPTQFTAYNGWLAGVKLDTRKLGVKGALRRLIMTSMRRNNLQDAYSKHEIFICTSCMSITADGFHYGYEADSQGKHVKGTLTNRAKLEYEISFTMAAMVKTKTEYQSSSCDISLDPITLTLVGSDADDAEEAGIIFDARLSKVQGFSFLADHIDLWMFNHFNSTVNNLLQEKLDSKIRQIVIHKNVCKEYLVS